MEKSGDLQNCVVPDPPVCACVELTAPLSNREALILSDSRMT